MKVNQAMEFINQDYYMLQENGTLLTQTTKPQAIANNLEMLDVREGQKVLEIGTGSGYSTAILTTLVGTPGKVVSIDIDPILTKRANEKLKDFEWVNCVTSDGRFGYESCAPYDRIIAWTTPDNFPNSWISQVADGGMIVTPFQVMDIVQSTVMVRFKKSKEHLSGDLVSPEGYIPMTSKPVVDFERFGPESQADLVGEGEEPFWVGTDWMKEAEVTEQWTQRFLNINAVSSPYQENGQAIRAYLLATKPKGYTFAFRPMDGDWIGYSTPDGFALVSFRQPNKWIISDETHATVLEKWWSTWASMGKPSYESIQPMLIGNSVKLSLKGGE
ncbi:protein-L-isoaspartate O-methyltransferase family protein [Shimazuella alba]|uniref:Protein-L-isoaspartate O-methyltransferase n=1 Tax=Shimazuella alba TaxID=2690964 RepID=A0A6I4VWJ6_9BACL|nr:rRNA adenine N-6-methyltransferase family protein [Shimazuella alba]MXQ55283.1 class I SAM-dependent methyltransferase [Shimazuella alba]